MECSSLLLTVVNYITRECRKTQELHKYMCDHKGKCMKEEKGFGDENADFFIKELAKSNQSIKLLFIKSLITKENDECTLQHNNNNYQYQYCYNKYTSVSLMRQWEKWHKPIFLENNSFLAQVLSRCLTHSSDSYKLTFACIIKNIKNKILNYSKQIKNMSIETEKNMAENEVIIIVKYAEFLTNLGFLNAGSNITRFLLQEFFNIRDFKHIYKQNDEFFFQQYKSKKFCEIKYHLCCILLVILNENRNINSVLNIIENLDKIMNQKFQYAMSQINDIQYTEFERDCYINVLIYFNEKSKFYYNQGDYYESLMNIEKSIKLLKALILGHKKFYKNLLQFKIKLPHYLFKIYIEVTIQNAKFFMIRNDYDNCEALFKIVFFTLKKYFKHERYIYALVFYEFGQYLLYRKKTDYAEHAFYQAEKILSNYFQEYICKYHAFSHHDSLIAADLAPAWPSLLMCPNYYLAKILIMRCHIFQIITCEISDNDIYYDLTYRQLKAKLSQIQMFVNLDSTILTGNNFELFYLKLKTEQLRIGVDLMGYMYKRRYILLEKTENFDSCMEDGEKLLNLIQRKIGLTSLETAFQFINLGLLNLLKSNNFKLGISMKTSSTYIILSNHYLSLSKIHLQTSLNIIKRIGFNHPYSVTSLIYLGYVTYLTSYPSQNEFELLNNAKDNFLHVAENIIKEHFPSNHYELKQIYLMLEKIYRRLHIITILEKIENKNTNYVNEFLTIAENYELKYDNFPSTYGLFSNSLPNLSNLMINIAPPCKIYCTQHCECSKNCIKNCNCPNLSKCFNQFNLDTIINSLHINFTEPVATSN